MLRRLSRTAATVRGGAIVTTDDPRVLHLGLGGRDAEGGGSARYLRELVAALDRLPGVLRVDLVDPLARLEDLPHVDLDVRRLPLEAR